MRIAHDFHLEFLPAEYRLFDQHFLDRGKLQAALDDFLELLVVVGNATAGSAEGEARPDDGGITHLDLGFEGILEIAHDLCPWALQADFGHGNPEQFTVFGHADGFARRADQFNAVFLQDSAIGQVQRAVQRGLATHGRQQGVGLFLGDDLLDHARIDRLDVDRIRRIRIGHDRGRIRVDEYHAIAFIAQGLAGLGPGIVELASLANDDRPGTDDENRAQVSSFWHQTRLSCQWFRRRTTDRQVQVPA